ncbi:MAG: leucine-rich repeat protein [Muribaculaceae bacterium]|nr:leucine-rich repeat protein [Muribaculaceae bacterium]
MKHLLIFTALFSLWTVAAAQNMPAGNENDPGRHWTPDEVCQPTHPQLLPASRHDFDRHDGNNDLAPRRGLRGSDTDRDELLRRHEQQDDGAQRVAPQTAGETFTVDGIKYCVNSDNASVYVTYTALRSSSNYNNINGAVSIPQSVYHNGKYYPVTAIGDRAFGDCSGLTSINIPNSVSSIRNYAFYNCSGLTSINIPNSVTSIGNYAFFQCSGLTSINIPNSVTSIGGDAFFHCSGLTSINIPNSVSSIGDYAFSGCSGLTSVTIGGSVSSIGDYAFFQCSGLTSITVDASNSVYDSRKNCNAIIETKTNTLLWGCKNTTIPNSVTSIGDRAFRDCSALTSINIPNSVSSIGEYAFYECTGLTSVTIPNSVTTIGEYAFNGCTGLTNVIVESGNRVYDSRDNCNAIIKTVTNTLLWGFKNTTIPNSVTSIGDCAFYYCTSLTSINIPNSVSSIGAYAFGYCSALTSINIPNSVSFIGGYAFDGCSSLMNFYSYRPTPPKTGNNQVFTDYYGISKLPLHATLHVIKGCTDSYRNSNTWNIFTTILDDLNPTDLVTSINLNKKELELDEWTTASTKLIATVLPNNATNKTIKWTTSNAAVATVNDGLVQGKESGTAYIIASTVDGSNLSDTCVVTVKPETILVQSVTINKAELNLTTGENEQLTATVLPDNATNKQVEWSSGNTAVATVSTDGVVSAVAPGNATITVRTTDGTNLTATCAITVVEPEPEFVAGDANGDGFVRINDVVTTSNYILGDEPAGFVFAAADVNQDGFVRINDVVLIANIILDGGMNAPAKVAAMQLAGNDYMTAQGVEIKAGETRFIDIELNNDNAFSALQMDINLPDGLILKGATLTGRADGHNLMTGRTVNGKATIAVFSTESNNFAGNNGAVIRLEVMATGNVTEDITLDNIFASTAKGVLKQLDTVSVGVNAVTGINDITVGNGLVNVYNTAGQLVRRNANASEATHNLPAGLYLVGGKKVVVK